MNRNKLPRYNVSPSDDGDSIADQKRSRSWDIIDRVTGGVVENCLTRARARTVCKELNAGRVFGFKGSAVTATNANAGGDRPSQ